MTKLVFPNETYDTFIGLYSYASDGSIHAKQCDELPTVHVNILHYVDWINSVIKNNTNESM